MTDPTLANRYKLLEFRADYEGTGLHVAPDWRYDLLGDYLACSYSYELVHRKKKGQKVKTLMLADFDKVAAVYNDFGPIGGFADAPRWWRERGMQLFGVSAPRPQVQVMGELKAEGQSMTANMQAHDALLLAIPRALTLPEVLRQLKAQLAQYEFAAALPAKISPKYKLQPSKLQKDTLLNGLEALRLYKRGVTLWSIGNQLELNGNLCMPEEKLEKMHGDAGTRVKAELAKAARRLIRKAAMIAENAARGRFPCDNSFDEAIVEGYSKRKAGRPRKMTEQKQVKNC